ncbi:MAG: phospholipase A [Marinobacter sp.]|nr:phospholipase A [Marinobacter sp.]
MRRYALSTLALLSIASHYAFADTPPCRDISDPEERLSCYDAASEQHLSDESPRLAEQAVDRTFARERALTSFASGFVPHRPSYILPATWMSSPNQNPVSPNLGVASYDGELDREEAKFQISFKVPLLTGVFDDRTTLWFGYTQISVWQLYNSESSRPFRETNYEPELFMRYETRLTLGPGRLDYIAGGLVHQSNGQSEPRSRSWDRFTAEAGYSMGRWLLIARPWYRIPESRNEDDNPDIERFLGHGDLWGIYKVNDEVNLSMRLRNNLRRTDNKTSVEAGFSFPLGESLKGFVQYYNGYGETMIDYNSRIHRFGIGITLNNLL